MAKISPPPIRENITDQNGNFIRVWVQWFTDQFNRINERIEQIADAVEGNLPIADADGSLDDSGYTPLTLPYFLETEFIDESAGAADAEKPVILDAGGHIDATMINDADIDHGTIGGLADDDHTQYLLADGSRNADELHVGGAVNYAEFAADGDLTFVGTAGLPFGSCSGYHMAWAQAAAQNTWYNVSDLDFIDGQLNDVTHDGSGKLTVGPAGKYLCNVSFDWECDAVNKHIEVGFEIEGGGSAATEGIVCNETKFANEEHSGSTTAILDLAAGETLEFCVRTTDIGAPTITVDCVNLNCVQIGGT